VHLPLSLWQDESVRIGKKGKVPSSWRRRGRPWTSQQRSPRPLLSGRATARADARARGEGWEGRRGGCSSGLELVGGDPPPARTIRHEAVVSAVSALPPLFGAGMSKSSSLQPPPSPPPPSRAGPITLRYVESP
jgi:hypothetical protein